MCADVVLDLPDDCWALVFRRLRGESRMDPVSLVCRRFLSIANHLRSDLTISDRAALVPRGGGASRLFRRFPNLRRIAVAADFRGDLDGLIRDVARSGLRLEALDLSGQRQWFPRLAVRELGARAGGGLRSLVLARFLLLESDDVLAVAESFPNLEELDISHPQQDLDHSCQLRQLVTDEAIQVLSSKLRNLRSIRLSGNHFLSDNALVSLALNCPMLTEIVAHNCSFMKGSGIAFAFRRCRNLATVSVNRLPALPRLVDEEGSLFFQARALYHLSLSRMLVPDELLVSLGNVEIPLLELSLSECTGLSFAGLSSALQAYGRSLRRLVLNRLGFLSDERMVAVLPHLSLLNSIDLSHCCDLGNPTFFSIVTNCAYIEKIEMRKTSVGRGPLPADLCVNSRIGSLQLSDNACLDDNTIQHIAEACPQLHSLDVSYCWEVTGEGIARIGEVCRGLTELSMKGCIQIRSLGTGLGFLKLETLLAAGSGLDDKALSLIALGCKWLSRLDLGGCSGVTEKGVKEVVRECKGLQQLYMGVQNVDINVLSWIVFSRPLLRKIVWQSGFLPMKMQDLFLRHGCMVSTSI